MDPVTKQEFISAVAGYVQKYAAQYGILVHSPVIAQAILESGWGQSSLAAVYHNYFGLKCGSKWTGPSVNLATKEEYQPGQLTAIRDNFRVYASMEEGVKGYFEFIQLARYENLKGITDPLRYLETIKADGYATSSTYVQNLMNIIEQYNLTEYDNEGSVNVSKVEKAIQQMEAWATNDSHGYDQKWRWGEKGDFDCSAAVIQAWESAGVPVKTNGATYTGNMLGVFKKTGFKDVTSQINLATGAGLIRGDVLLNSGHHAAMYCGNGKEVEASINENGTITGGTPGDQTGKEFLIRAYRNYPWTNVLRYAETTAGGKSIDEVVQEVIKGNWGNGNARREALAAAGYDYAAVQARVNEILTGKASTPDPEPEPAPAPEPTPAPVEPQTSGSWIDAAAREVIAGKWGNGQDRKERLYSAIQARVNELLR